MKKIPFLSFNVIHSAIRDEVYAAFEKVYDDGWFINGKQVENFENRYAIESGSKYCVGVSNGLDALYLALKSLDIKSGDEVIIPSNTYIATALAISYVGANIVFVEPDIRTYNIDVQKIERAITNKTKAIIPVHLFGQSCDMEMIMTLAAKYNLFVVEDNAQSQGGMFKGRKTGSWGHVNATSFYPGKNLGALGDAGAVTTNDKTLCDTIRMLKNYGSIRKYQHDIIGHNMRLDEIQAAFLKVKLNHLTNWNNSRISIALKYFNLLKNVGDIILPFTQEHCIHVFHLFVVRTKSRDRLRLFLQENGIETMIHYPIPPYRQNAYKHLGLNAGIYPIADELADTMLSLPMHPGMTDDDVEYISNVIKSFFE